MLGRGVGDSYIVFVLPLSERVRLGRAQVSSVYSVYLVVSGLSAPLTGMLIDRWGARVVYRARPGAAGDRLPRGQQPHAALAIPA